VSASRGSNIAPDDGRCGSNGAPEDACRGCGARDLETLQVQRGLRIAASDVDERFDLFTRLCAGCGLVFTHPQPDEALLRRFYAQQHRDLDLAGARIPGEGSREDQAEWLAARLGALGGLRVLEIGCYDGYLLELLRRRGAAECRGVEPSLRAAEAARRRFGLSVECAFFEDVELPAGGFDLVALSHVLEHVRDPLRVLHGVRRLLAPHGRVFVEVPNVLSPRVPCVVNFFTFDHLWNFSPRTLEALAGRAGLRGIALDTDFPFPAFRALFELSEPVAPARDPIAAAECRQAGRDYVEARRAYLARLAETLDPRVDAWCAGGARVALYGAGQHTEQLLDTTRLGEARIVAIADGHPAKQGTTLRGIPVVAPEALPGLACQAVVISSYDFQDEMAARVRELCPALPELVTLYPSTAAFSNFRRARARCDVASAPTTGADALADVLRREGLERVYLYPGGTIVPTLNAWIARGGAYVVARHEQGAGYAALAHSRLGGRPQVAMVTSGPGVTNVATVVADAYYDSTPLVVIAGQVGTADLCARPRVRQRGFQEVPTAAVLGPIAKACLRPMRPAEAGAALQSAFDVAREGRPGPVVLELPMDVQRGAIDAAEAPAPAAAREPVRPRPDPTALDELAALLEGAERPVLLAGQGVLQSGAWRALRSLAERCRAPVATSLLGVGAFPSRHALSLGYVGHTGHGVANRAVHACDLLVVLGARLDVRQTGTRTADFVPGGRVVRVDLDLHELQEGRVRSALDLHADAREVLEWLDAALVAPPPPARETWLDAIERWRKELPLDDYPAGRGCHPRELLRALDAATGAGPLVVVTGVGHHQQWAARHMRFEAPGRWLLTSGGHGAMGYDLPSAVGACFARPGVPVLCVVGDGSFQINVQELGTIREYDLPVKIAVVDNQRLAMVSQFQKITFGDDPGTGDRAPLDFAALARAYGLPSFALPEWTPEAPEVLRRFLASPGPALLWARVDPACEVSPMLLAGQTLDAMWPWSRS
jgi:acetolactate synthase-1/2/3 large subunit